MGTTGKVLSILVGICISGLNYWALTNGLNLINQDYPVGLWLIVYASMHFYTYSMSFQGDMEVSESPFTFQSIYNVIGFTWSVYGMILLQLHQNPHEVFSFFVRLSFYWTIVTRFLVGTMVLSTKLFVG